MHYMEQINQLSSRTCGNLNQVSCQLAHLQRAAVTLGMGTLAADLNEAISILRITSEDIHKTTQRSVSNMFDQTQAASHNLFLTAINAIATNHK